MKNTPTALGVVPKITRWKDGKNARSRRESPGMDIFARAMKRLPSKEQEERRRPNRRKESSLAPKRAN